MKVVVPLAKNILAPLGIAAAASATDAGIKKKTWFWDNYFNNFKQKMNHTMKIVQALEDSNILLKSH